MALARSPLCRAIPGAMRPPRACVVLPRPASWWHLLHMPPPHMAPSSLAGARCSSWSATGSSARWRARSSASERAACMEKRISILREYVPHSVSPVPAPLRSAGTHAAGTALRGSGFLAVGAREGRGVRAWPRGERAPWPMATRTLTLFWFLGRNELYFLASWRDRVYITASRDGKSRSRRAPPSARQLEHDDRALQQPRGRDDEAGSLGLLEEASRAVVRAALERLRGAHACRYVTRRPKLRGVAPRGRRGFVCRPGATSAVVAGPASSSTMRSSRKAWPNLSRHSAHHARCDAAPLVSIM